MTAYALFMLFGLICGLLIGWVLHFKDGGVGHVLNPHPT